MLITKPLTMANLIDVRDGILARMVDTALWEISTDMERAGSDLPDKRKLTIEIEFEPQFLQGELEGVSTTFKVSKKIPARQVSQAMILRKTANGALLPHFNQESFEDPDQHTFGFSQEEDEAEADSE
mgnify:CR=1 FL=1